MRKNTSVLLSTIFALSMLYFVSFQTACRAQSPSRVSNRNLIDANSYSNSIFGRTLWTVAFNAQLTPTQRRKLFYFDGWENKGWINNKYSITNINYSLYDEALACRISSDSVYLFDQTHIDQFTISGKKFKKVYLGSSKGRKFLELLYTSPDGRFQLLKRHYVSVTKGDVDPLMIRKNRMNIARLSDHYLIKNSTPPIEIGLNKKSILAQFLDQKDRLLSLAKTHKLSFKKEVEMVKLLKYFHGKPDDP